MAWCFVVKEGARSHLDIVAADGEQAGGSTHQRVDHAVAFRITGRQGRDNGLHRAGS